MNRKGTGHLLPEMGTGVIERHQDLAQVVLIAVEPDLCEAKQEDLEIWL